MHSMRGWVTLVILCTSTGALAETDEWLGTDKALHGSISGLLAIGGYAGSAQLTDSFALRVTAGAGFALGLGAIKECADLAGFGAPSWKDFAWDAIGAASGVLLAWAIDYFIVRRFLGQSPERSPREPPAETQTLPSGPPVTTVPLLEVGLRLGSLSSGMVELQCAAFSPFVVESPGPLRPRLSGSNNFRWCINTAGAW